MDSRPETPSVREERGISLQSETQKDAGIILCTVKGRAKPGNPSWCSPNLSTHHRAAAAAAAAAKRAYYHRVVVAVQAAFQQGIEVALKLFLWKQAIKIAWENGRRRCRLQVNPFPSLPHFLPLGDGPLIRRGWGRQGP